MRKIIKILFLIIIPVCASGQMKPYTNQYLLNPLTINPAFAGNRGVTNISGFYRKQWVGVKGAPETMALTIDAPFSSDRMGLGFIITNDKMGVTKETELTTNYAYRIALKNGSLSFGLAAGLMATNTAWSDLVVLDPGDEYMLIDSKVFVVPSFSFGAYYSNRKYFAGFSIPRLVGYKFDFEKNKYVLSNNMKDYYYLFNTGFLIDMSPNLKFIPSALLAFSPGNKMMFDLNAHFRLMDRFMFGASYRNDRAISALFQVQLTDQLKFAYTYDYDFARLSTFSSGSHEIMLRFEFRKKVNAISPLNF